MATTRTHSTSQSAPIQASWRAFVTTFADLMNLAYLRVVAMPPNPWLAGRFIVNTKYGFVFSHESPSHDPAVTRDWPGGPRRYVRRNFAELRKRYAERVAAWRAYLSSGAAVTLLLTRFDAPTPELEDAMRATYPGVDFSIVRFDNGVRDPPNPSAVLRDHLLLCGLARDSAEYRAAAADAEERERRGT